MFIKQLYVLFSVDTEHDIISQYETSTAGWSKGIPLLCEVFDEAGIKSKVCWLLEYNVKEGIVAANVDSEFYVDEFTSLIDRIVKRRDELGIHPTMYDWIGGDGHLSKSMYNQSNLWDITRSSHDQQFVSELITSASHELKRLCTVSPIGCRTGSFYSAIGLAKALEQNEIYIDSSILKGMIHRIKGPNAYYSSRDDIYRAGLSETLVLEIPTVGYIQSGFSNFCLSFRTLCLPYFHRPLFLSFFIHNWQAITPQGEPNYIFLNSLSSFLHVLNERGAQFTNWSEAREVFSKIS